MHKSGYIQSIAYAPVANINTNLGRCDSSATLPLVSGSPSQDNFHPWLGHRSCSCPCLTFLVFAVVSTESILSTEELGYINDEMTQSTIFNWLHFRESLFWLLIGEKLQLIRDRAFEITVPRTKPKPRRTCSGREKPSEVMKIVKHARTTSSYRCQPLWNPGFHLGTRNFAMEWNYLSSSSDMEPLDANSVYANPINRGLETRKQS